jgi:hypothetical protein
MPAHASAKFRDVRSITCAHLLEHVYIAAEFGERRWREIFHWTGRSREAGSDLAIPNGF